MKRQEDCSSRCDDHSERAAPRHIGLESRLSRCRLFYGRDPFILPRQRLPRLIVTTEEFFFREGGGTSK